MEPPAGQETSATEAERLRELYSLDLLDTPSEPRFDAITQLAARSLGVPIALVSLVDARRQWFKSAVGLTVPQTPREHSFCSHALTVPDVMVVPDATQDPRFARNPLVTGEPHIRFYAGAVIRGPRSAPLGTLCVIDRVPRQLSDEDRARLLHLARLVEWEIRQDQLIGRMLLEVEHDKLSYSTSAIPDRRAVYERLATEMAHGQPLLVALGRIDDGASIASTGAGKATLQWELTSRLHRLPPGFHVGLWRHNQFLVFRSIEIPEAEPRAFVDELRGVLEGDYEFGGYPVAVRTLVGIASFPTDADSIRSLLKCAQAAMPSAGGDAFRVGLYARDVATEQRRRDDIARRLPDALLRERLLLVHQPIVDLASDRIVGAEALLRWTDPRLGSVSPTEFVPVAEDSELILGIGTYVLKTVVAQIKQWQQAGVPVVRISVNISGRQLHDPAFVDFVIDLVRGADVEPRLLALEVTEHVLITDLQAAARAIARLHAAGIQCSIDDFGVGFSSLNYVRRLPIEALKIDHEFVVGIEGDRKAVDVIAAIVSMSRALGLKTVAEGVETPAQLEPLRRVGCEFAQGFLFAPGGTADDLAERLVAQAGR